MQNVKKEVVLIGAGKIGKGYAADLFNEAGYKLIFLCRSLKQAEQMRRQGAYTLFKYMEDEEEPRVSKIKDYEAYSTEAEYEKCLDVLSKTNYATIHLYPQAFRSIGNMIGDAIKKRVKDGNDQTLDIILCINLVDPQLIIRQHIEERLETKEEWDCYREKIGLVLALTFRWGANPRPYMLQQDPLASCVADSPDLPVDRDAFHGPIPEGVALRPLNKMRERLVYKIWCGNVIGCIVAMLAQKEGYTYVHEGNQNDEIFRASVLGAKEAEFGYDQVYSLTREEKEENFHGRRSRDRWSREQKTKRLDEITRVGADPARKLARDDRLIGPALACIKNGKIPFFLTKAAASAFYFDNPEDVSAPGIQAYLAENGIEKTIVKYCQLDLNDEYDKMVYELVLAHYYDMYDGKDIDFTKVS